VQLFTFQMDNMDDETQAFIKLKRKQALNKLKVAVEEQTKELRSKAVRSMGNALEIVVVVDSLAGADADYASMTRPTTTDLRKK